MKLNSLYFMLSLLIALSSDSYAVCIAQNKNGLSLTVQEGFTKSILHNSSCSNSTLILGCRLDKTKYSYCQKPLSRTPQSDTRSLMTTFGSDVVECWKGGYDSLCK